MIRELPYRHPDLFDTVAREELERAGERLLAASKGTKNGWIAELLRFTALPGARGKNGHTGVWPLQSATGFGLLPIKLYAFEEGLYVVDAVDESLVGGRLVRIGSTPARDAFKAVGPLVFRDNEMGILRFGPTFLVIPELLQGLGLVEDPNAVELTVELDVDAEAVAGKAEQRVLTLAPVSLRAFRERFKYLTITGPPRGGRRAALPERPPKPPFWHRVLPESRTLYVQFNEVVAKDDEAGRFEELLSPVGWGTGRQGGGSSRGRCSPQRRWQQHHLRPAPRAPAGRVEKRPAPVPADRPGHLLGGRELRHRRRTQHPRRTGGGGHRRPGRTSMAIPRTLKLPASGIEVMIPTRYWEKGGPDDTRLTHEPDVWAKPTAAAYFRGEDSALAAALEHEPNIPIP